MSSFEPETLRALGTRVREFLAACREEGLFEPECDAWTTGWDRAFSRRLAREGWVGMTIPERYGGSGGSHLERFVVGEELLAAGAPVAAHWVTERQIAPMLLELGTEEQRTRFLPRIAAAEVAFALGMSEPGSGSDLASVRSRARRTEGGWLLTGQKIWTTNAHRAEHAVVLCRTGEDEARHSGLSQLIVDLRGPGVDIRVIPASIGNDHFAEVFFDEAFVADEDVLGTIGAGWRQVTTELGYERGGSDRFMSNLPLLEAYADGSDGQSAAARAVTGELVARMVALRALAMGVAEAAEAGRDFAQGAALAKDAGGVYEQHTVEAIRSLGISSSDGTLNALLRRAILAAPTVTLRGGSTEVLRSITARGLVGR
jgi:alkylation response protein AidB-like acyl-CoA dehydrogenase